MFGPLLATLGMNEIEGAEKAGDGLACALKTIQRKDGGSDGMQQDSIRAATADEFFQLLTHSLVASVFGSFVRSFIRWFVVSVVGSCSGSFA